MNFLSIIITFFPFLLALNCIFLIFFKKWLGPIATFNISIFILAFCIIIASNEIIHFLSVGSYYYIDFGRWFFCIDFIDSHIVFCIDILALVCSILVLTLTIFALYFGIEYMYREAFINRLLYLLFMFATSVVFLFFCYDFFLIILIWECIGLFSLLLVNFYSMRIYTIKAALKTFIFSRISDCFMFFSFILVVNMFNTCDLALIFLQIPFLSYHYLFMGYFGVHFLSLFSFTIAVSGVIKAAQFFSHVWLPDAMEAPTPASALIHSSTLVVAGIFLILRFSLLFEFVIFTNYYLALLGAITLAYGAITAIYQTDIKKLVAYSTISQIGYLVCGCGFCCYEEVLVYLIVHALNKAFLFVLVGYLVHFFVHNTDMRQMGGVYLYSFDLYAMLFGVSLNLAGLPYSAGFLAKEFLLFQVLRDDFLSLIVRGCWLVSFFFTPIYIFMIMFMAIFGPKKSTILAYITFWNFNYYLFFKLIINHFSNKSFYYRINHYILFRFQYSIITCRTTIYVLFFFWTFLFFFGEFLLLIIYNFTTINETIPSNYFFSFKTFNSNLLNASTIKLQNLIMLYILLFSSWSFLYLLNLKFEFNYKYFYILWQLDILLLISASYCFLPLSGFFLILLLLINFAYTRKSIE